ncbi:uncharacterized protein BO97DRAFT_341811 [Aspergillus homomorphus CBS 101889]|uniref:Restriction endonuclease type IV Mrr domain-containing protein n=1 Tax=Aspergillus homomorphus (strain CBS 101889) TaxID=1450537 RepID=A0A395I1Z2_ASPHC|nr:hypothetical protein BO97DRAFT_341811 [Aspergillus homomorphus CBS 101889]RAL13755.1 hypothetical protein BO97DRAFT_341811 [Aspergillus homomorphus CBS 101889]
MTSTLSFFSRRVHQLPMVPIPHSNKHYNLPSFLEYARRHNLPPTSTTYLGNLYEYTAQAQLRNGAALLLHRTGGRDDKGMDLLGTWHLPGHELPIHVAMQCKAHRRRLGPQHIRELEGTISRRMPQHWRSDGRPRVGVLVGRAEATPGVRSALRDSPVPLVYFMMDLRGSLRQALWNEAVEGLGLTPLGVEVIHATTADEEGPPPIRLTWDGHDLYGMDYIEAHMARQEEKWWRLWNLHPNDQETRYEALAVIQSRFPDEKPLLWAKGGTPSLMCEKDRLGLLRELALMGYSEGPLGEGESAAVTDAT